MPYKTVLVHLNNAQRVSRLISAAVLMARPAEGHLTGLYVVPHVSLRSPVFPRISGSIIRSGLDDYRRAGQEVRTAFEAAIKGLPLVGEYRLYEPSRDGYAEAVLDQSRAADLIIVSQKESDWDYADMFDIPDLIAMESGRPTLLVPRTGRLDSIGKRVLVAWNNSREAARAVFDALPILQRAESVRVLCVHEPAKTAQTGRLAGTEIGAALARHGIKCTLDYAEASRGEPGERLLADARSMDCDLIVMGCYGRTRLRELVLGGASRHIMHNTDIPVLLSH